MIDRLLTWFLIYSLVLGTDSRRILMPKVEINMLLEELSSQEAKDFVKKKTNNQTSTANSPNSSDSMNNSTSSSSSEDFDDSTPDLISSVVSVPLVIPDYDAKTTGIPEDFSEPETSTSSGPMLLSEFANHLAKGIRPRIETTTLPLPDFPTPKPAIFETTPDETFPYMVAEAKDFIRRYLSPEQWRKLRILLKTIKEVGGSRQDIHRAATVFISKVCRMFDS
uniref:Integrator complex subunit 6-like n=1 Tax=Caenorhabditis tropicalis TaxID=1561998 RepID=A0A1I7U086_9PELO